MKLNTIFNRDITNKRMNITREFAAPVADVWRAWTDSKILDQWWAPKPWQAKTKTMDFREGGHWLYCMIGPDGAEGWARADYLKIEKGVRFSLKDCFCDSDGNPVKDFPSMNWNNTFHKTANGTRVEVVIDFDSEADLLKIAELGFQEGFTSAHDNLDELFATQKVHQ